MFSTFAWAVCRHNPASIPPSLPATINGKPLTVLTQATDSLNNRFLPIPALRTDAVLTIDDDIEVRALPPLHSHPPPQRTHTHAGKAKPQSGDGVAGWRGTTSPSLGGEEGAVEATRIDIPRVGARVRVRGV